jgi:predicted PurR-regulated permease PerM
MKSHHPNPWDWLTERRVTYALKLVMLLVLILYVGQFVLGFFDHIRAVVYILIGSIFFAYLIYPAVHWLRARRVPLALAIVIVYAAIFAALAAAVWFVVPRLVEEVTLFVQRYPDFVARMDRLVNDPTDPATARMPDWLRHQIARIPGDLGVWVKSYGLQSFGHIVAVLAGTFAAVATFIIIPMVTAYLLLDLENLKRQLSAVVPERRWRAMLELLAEFDAVVGGFIRGQLLVAISVGVLIAIALTVLGVPYALLLGLIAAVGDLIPYVGAVLAFLPAFFAAFFANGIVNALIVAGAFVIIYEAEGHLLAPNIVSKTVKLSPFVVLVALLIGAELGGIVGMLVAVPIAGILRVLFVRVFRRPDANEPTP